MSVLLRGVPFNTDEQLDCFTLALESLLRFYGLDLALLHFDQWHFSAQAAGRGQLQLAAQTRDYAASLARFGVELRAAQEADFASGWEALCAELDQGRPLLVILDTPPLRACYYPGQPRHSLHAVVVNGCDTEEVWIVDPSPYTAFAGAIPLEIFGRAWQGGEAFTWYALRVPAARGSRAPRELQRCLAQNIEGMLGGQRAGWGISGIRRLAEWLGEVATWPESEVGPLLTQATQLKGVALARRMHARFLDSAAARLEQPALSIVGEQLQEVAQEWMVARNLALKGGRSGSGAVAARLGRRLWALAEWEELLLGGLAAEVDRG